MSFDEARDYWDREAPTFDDEPDHGLRDPDVRAAWVAFLQSVVPETAVSVLDIGCGTGSLSVVLAQLGYQVTGIDLSSAMIDLARKKGADQQCEITFHVMNAIAPEFKEGSFDVILCRHLLWALPEPESVLEHWGKLLAPNGRLLLVEGYWGNGGGLHGTEILSMLPDCFGETAVQNLSGSPEFWGKSVDDERYCVIADKQ